MRGCPGARAHPPDHRTVRDAAAGITVLAVANFVAITTEVLPVGLLPQLARGVDVAEETAGLLVTVYAFVVAALALPLTLATRRLPRKGLLLTTLGVYVASNVVVALAPTFAVVAAGRTLGGIGHAVFFSVSIAYAARLVGPLHTGRALTLVTGGGTLGFVLGVPLGTSLGAAVGWRWSFAVLAAVCLVTALLVARLLPAVTVPPATAGTTHERRAGTSRLVAVAATNTAVFAGQYTVYTYVALLLLATGLTEGLVGPVLLVFGATGLVGLWAAGRFLDRRPRTLTLVTLGVVVGSLLAVAAALPAALPVLVACCLWLAAFGALPATFQAAALRTRGAGADVAGSVVNATANFGIGAGAAVGSQVIGAAGPAVLALVGAAVVGVALVVVLLARDAFPAEAG
ncbi:putative MFS family arabinose efflux permease [Isoptericola jiangsuensis]|uniref:Putative MFS family arabinose efflux permease n=1 Tax=Isoptericola jiangsuensis TaxID=548579 RepID=A0A2A9EV74_9MICO|nr:MFS transporter [Isoptericola jiangsuensis]PFG42788.1 putative MFS family arabinose efflux permease [Isoptericola jiangsuensis]